jgi:hypothetical protein
VLERRRKVLVVTWALLLLVVLPAVSFLLVMIAGP